MTKERRQRHEIAGIMSELTAEIEALCARMCLYPVVISGHFDELQRVDRLAQKIAAIGQVLDAECPITAAGALRLEELHARLASPSDPMAAH
jgi:hypothetical protein